VSWVIYFFGSGAAFFAGVGLVLAGVALVSFYRRGWSTAAANLCAFLGLALIALSATPLPYWLYGLAGAITLFWLVVERSRRKALLRCRKWIRAATAVVWLAAVAMEVPYHIAPTLPAGGRSRLYIFADSVAAGLGEPSKDTWPKLLAGSQSIDVRDHSQIGATVHVMLRKADELVLGDGVVLLEIGGNDVLGTTTASEFEQNLDALLVRVGGPGRIVVMFELPLPPFYNAFGMAQRRLAAKHQVFLIPKRIFVTVLTADDATLDSIHLSLSGHERMAETVWRLIEPAFGD